MASSYVAARGNGRAAAAPLDRVKGSGGAPGSENSRMGEGGRRRIRGEREKGGKWGPPQITPTRKATRAFARLVVTISNVTF